MEINAGQVFWRGYQSWNNDILAWNEFIHLVSPSIRSKQCHTIRSKQSPTIRSNWFKLLLTAWLPNRSMHMV